ncbi:hypothetical protein PAMP_021218 [Pampus punctatissimus]
MPSIGPSVFILGFIMIAAIAAQTTTEISNIDDQNNTITATTSKTPGSDSTSETPFNIPITNSADSITSTDYNMKTSTIAPWTTPTRNEGSDTSTLTSTALTTTKPTTTSQSIKSTTKGKRIIILVLIIIIAIGFAIACFFTRRRGRQSVDFPSRQDEANIPLSTMEPEYPVGAEPQNGLKTFESTETGAKEPQEPETNPLVQEDPKAEPDKSDDPSAESAAPAPSADGSEDKPKEDVAEQSPPPPPVEPNMQEKTDNEDKTSVEVTNENNSNNVDVTQKKDWKLTAIFWDVSLDSPV